MAQCAYCGTETQLYHSNTPICIQCDTLSPERRTIRTKLFRQRNEAVKRADSANEAFKQVTTEIPSGMPLSDGAQRIKNVSRQLSIARDEVMAAHDRLNDFLDKGIVPDDLKRGG